jgi:phthalate 4,5-dioxygenase oxygenase subunit
MLTHEENELLTRTGPGTPMGNIFRRSWLPALLSEELEADGEPKQIQLLGQRLVAFRDSQGRAGVLDENCPHRGASLAYGRNEESGLRCIYHGWKVDVEGRIVDTPSEPEDSTFKDRIRHRAYGVREAGGIIWAYLGPAEQEPAFPEWQWLAAPADQVEINKVFQECNYAQGLEGSIDSVHSDFLHSSDIRGRPSDHRPKLEVEDRPYGFRYAAIRRPDGDGQASKYVRITLFVAPCFVLIPVQRRGPGVEIVTHQAWVPIDDEHNYFFSVRWNRCGPIVKDHAAQFQMDGDFRPARNRANKHLQDRAAMKAGNWSGIQGVNSQDFAVVESMGPIYDRTREHLGSTDMAIARFRRLMIQAARSQTPLGLDGSTDYSRLATEERVVPADMPWQQVAPCS